MLKSLAIVTLLQVFMLACETDLKLTVVRRPQPSEEYCLSNPDKFGCPDFMESVRKDKAFELEETSSNNTFEGQVVRLKGASFDEHLKVTIEGQDVAVFKTSDTEALFVTPSFASPGLKTAILKRLERSIEFKLFILADKIIDPAALTEPSQLCEGTEFMAADGSIVLGSKACANMVSGVNCSEDGEVGCMTTAIFKAADTTGAANKILAGQIVGGVEGKVTRSADLAPCSADGEVGCETTAVYKAARVIGAESKILAGQTMAGVSGNVTLPAANKVLSGNSFGVAGTGVSGSLTLPSAQNVLSGSGAYGDTAALMTPTLTLPAVGKVLTATAYGVAGTGSTGTLTLPAAGNVLSTNGNYGDAAALSTPTLTLPAVGKVLTATAYGVAGTGSTGTLTLPAAGNVLSTNGNYGDAGALSTPTLTLPAAGKVLSGTSYGIAGAGSTGGLTLPIAGHVLAGTGAYGDTAALITPTLTLPAVGKVLAATAYGVAGSGSMGTLTLPSAGNVRSSAGAYGETGSTVTGTISDCAANGSACYIPSYVLSTQPLRAISYDAIDAGKASIRSTLTLGGVTGTLANCADGDIGCYILGPNFKAAAVTGSSGDKILFGQTLAGYSGTVTLPLASKVLTGHSYGVGGNGLAGSLTVPAAGNVLSGSGTYGNALAPLTPTLTLPNSSQVLTGTSFGVSGSTSSGALTLPSAGNVLAGSGSYGDSLSQTSPTYVCPSYVRPASPSITSVNFDLGPDRVTVNWGAVSGTAGYIVIMKSNAAVTWTPTDGQSYTTGAQGSDIIIYSGTGTSVTYNTNVTAGITYSFAVYSYIANNIYSYLPSTSSLTSCAGLSGSWVAVPGDSTYGTSGFCVMKYEAKNVGGTATSAASGTPWVDISQTAAQEACSSLGANFHLITNDEWMSLASNIASVGTNWSGLSVGSGLMNRGHSDTNPGSACAASTDDSFAYVEADCTALDSGTWSQKRTHTLSTGAVIWDVAGNVWDWTSYVISSNNAKPYVSADAAPQAAWRELSAVDAGFTATAMTLHDLRPINAEKSFWSDSWNSAQGLGQYYAGSNSGGALRRGADWNYGTNVGVFSANLNYLPSYSHPSLGFRCVRVASP